MHGKKNYSFYMPEDFDEKIDLLRQNLGSLKNLSKSQSVYFLISEILRKYTSGESGDPSIENDKDDEIF